MQLTIYKILLGVKKQTSRIAVYGELGCYPLSILYLERSMNYFLKVVNCETLIHIVLFLSRKLKVI